MSGGAVGNVDARDVLRMRLEIENELEVCQKQLSCVNIEDTAPIAVCPVVDNPRCDQPIIELDGKDLVGDESRINADDDAKVSALPKGTSSVENILDGSLCEILPYSPIDSSCNAVRDLGANRLKVAL